MFKSFWTIFSLLAPAFSLTTSNLWFLRPWMMCCHFWVSISLGFKARISHWYENDSLFFHNNGFAHSLVFKVRVSGTRKWPNNFGCLTFLPCSSVNVKHDHWSTNICLTPDTSGLWCRLYINGWLLLHWRQEKSIKTKDTLTWVQESKSLVVSTVDCFPSIPKRSRSSLNSFK